jgi:hypothetical protein
MPSARRAALLTVSIVVLTALTLVSALAFGFFAFPILIAVAAWALFYWALRHQGVRNPLSPLDPSISERWTDGQPLARAGEHDAELRELDQENHEDTLAIEAKQERYAEERAEAELRTRPSDFQGPPPVNPFP